MGHKRKEFTELQKAKIFVRDRATCAFSGISLWLFDNGIKSNWQIDWVDHIIPSSKGGQAELTNGICSSNFFNSKKKNNSSDNLYFFKNGQVTEHYIRVYGVPTNDLIERLSRLKNLEISDWFINRSISGIFTGFDCRCDKEFKGKDYARNDKYWFNSAWNRLLKFQKKKVSTLEERGLIKNLIPFGTNKLMELENMSSEKIFYNWIEEIYPAYRLSYKAFYEYFDNPLGYNPKFIENEHELHPGVLNAIKAHNNNT